MDALEKYVQRLAEIIQRGDAREESYYPALEELIKTLSQQVGQQQTDVTTLPKRTEAGNPDFRVWDGSHRVTGYIEAKQPGTDLNNIAETEQLQRYRGTFPNVILTDFFEFRLYKEGELVDKVSIGRPFVAQKLGEAPPLENVDTFLELLKQFFSHSVPRTLRASSLAKELAKRTRFLEHVVERELVEEQNKNLTGFFKAFQQHLMSGLQKPEFADLYAQTVTYGLFAARTRADDTFTRTNAVDFIPSTIGILKEVFQFISYGELPENIRWIVDDIAEILNAADIQQILDRYYEEGKGKDPIIHFYETFLSEYDPDLREQRGVYYTPEPVVGYIVRSVHQTLKEEFDKPLGLADSSVTVLDPAGGTLTFIAEAFKTAVTEYATKYGQGGVPELINNHLLENFYAFELMMAPYAIGHLKMGFILEELGYQLQDDERFNLYLTNTLEMEELEQTELPGMASLSEESKAAGKVKKDEEVLVILGNPPYSGHSANNSPWIDNLLKDGYTHANGHEDDGYYFVDGEPLDERNPKWLQDDYVKFIRFAQWKIDQYGQGIVGYITNHSYLDNPTFRGMRESLANSFDDLRFLDLHGNSLKKETTPDGSKDENVFDIRAGVSIALLHKKDQEFPAAGEDRGESDDSWKDHIIPYNSELTELARKLRNDSTKSEIALWKHLKGKQMHGYDFDRQKPVDEFICDFFCRELMLAIELDGYTHQFEDVQVNDAQKEERLNELGINVLRFDDDDVLQEPEHVLNTIEAYVEAWESDDTSAFDAETNTPLNPLSRGDFILPSRNKASAATREDKSEHQTQNKAFPSAGGDRGGLILRGDVYGLRNDKYEWLDAHHIKNTDWTEIHPQSPFYFFKEQDYDLREVYQKFISVNDLFPVNSVGIVTARDHFTLHWNKDEVWRTITKFKDLPEEEARTLFELGEDSRDWKVNLAQQDIKDSGPDKKQIVDFLYRPFNKRITYYTGNSRGFHCMPRSDVMRHMLAGKNIGLISPKRVELDQGWSNCMISNSIIGHVAVSAKTIDYFFPLYLYPETDTENNDKGKDGGTMMMVFEEDTEYTERRPNINNDFYALLQNTYGQRPTPEQVLYYSYAVLYAPTYRQTYAEFLKSDFPRVPFTTNYELFCELAALGEQLTELHLMKSKKLNDPIAKFQGTGSNVIAKPKRVGRNYQPDEERVYINKDEQYFEGIPEEIWEYQVGGYQVLDKWLYDRRERKLSNQEIQHYCRVVTALYHTIELQKEIDEIYPGVEEDVIPWEA